MSNYLLAFRGRLDADSPAAQEAVWAKGSRQNNCSSRWTWEPVVERMRVERRRS